MNRKGLIVALPMLFLVLVVFNSTSWAEGNVNVMYGMKYLDSDDWEPTEKNQEFGLMVDFKAENWPLSIAIDILFSEDDDYLGSAKVEAKTQEFNLGIRKYFPINQRLKSYLGGGLAFINAEASASLYGLTATQDDDGIGVWLSGGAVYTVADHFNIGLDLRYSKAEVTIGGVDGEAGGAHILVFAGFHF